MRAAAGVLALLLVAAVAVPAGSQDGAIVVRPKVLVRTDVPPPGPPPQEPQSFGVTLVVKFWVEEAGKETLAVELRCATPEYHVKLAKDTGDLEHRLEVGGVIQMLRDREILLLFEADLGSAGQKLANTVETTGSAILREGVEKILLKTADTSLHVTFAFDVAD